MPKCEIMVKVLSSDIDIEKIDFIEADFQELRVHMKDGRIVTFVLEKKRMPLPFQSKEGHRLALQTVGR